jgi:hypothetical protein
MVVMHKLPCQSGQGMRTGQMSLNFICEHMQSEFL